MKTTSMEVPPFGSLDALLLRSESVVHITIHLGKSFRAQNSINSARSLEEERNKLVSYTASVGRASLVRGDNFLVERSGFKSSGGDR